MRAPTPAIGHIPFKLHRTIAQIDAADENRRVHAGRLQVLRDIHRGPRIIPPQAPDRSPCPRCGIRADIGCDHTLPGHLNHCVEAA